MTLRLPLRSPWPLTLALLGLAVPTAGQTQAPSADPGWTPVIAGAPASMSPDAFAEAVVAELPDELFDRATNFTNHEAYRPDADYRLVMVFHGAEEGPPAGELCAVNQGDREAIAASKPKLDDLMTTTGVTAAFCENGEALSTATDKITGQAQPGQLSFGFLVADIAKQLFPDGFDIVPRRVAPTPVPPG